MKAPKNKSLIPSRILILFSGIFFLVTAALKTHLIATDPFVELHHRWPTSFVFIASVVEYFIAAVLFSRTNLVLKSFLSSMAFLAIGVVGGILTMVFEQPCGCFGSVEVPDWLPSLVALTFFALHLIEGHNRCGSLSEFLLVGIHSFRNALREQHTGLIGLSLSAIPCFAISFAFGDFVDSESNRGSVVAEIVQLGDLMVGDVVEVAATLRNEGSEALTIIGVQTSCTCMTLLTDRKVLIAGEAGEV